MHVCTWKVRLKYINSTSEGMPIQIANKHQQTMREPKTHTYAAAFSWRIFSRLPSSTAVMSCRPTCTDAGCRLDRQQMFLHWSSSLLGMVRDTITCVHCGCRSKLRSYSYCFVTLHIIIQFNEFQEIFGTCQDV